VRRGARRPTPTAQADLLAHQSAFEIIDPGVDLFLTFEGRASSAVLRSRSPSLAANRSATMRQPIAASRLVVCRIHIVQSELLRTACSPSRTSRSMSLSCFFRARSSRRRPPRFALSADLAFPRTVAGPVDRSHGFQVRISADCLALRSGVQPFAMVSLQ